MRLAVGHALREEMIAEGSISDTRGRVTQACAVHRCSPDLAVATLVDGLIQHLSLHVSLFCHPSQIFHQHRLNDFAGAEEQRYRSPAYWRLLAVMVFSLFPQYYHSCLLEGFSCASALWKTRTAVESTFFQVSSVHRMKLNISRRVSQQIPSLLTIAMVFAMT